jgi:hypothetical protein
LLAAMNGDVQKRQAVEATFLAILTGIGIEDSHGDLMALQQTANLLPIVAGPETMTRLRSGDLRQDHPFLQRAIAVADALHCDQHYLLDEFVQRMEQNHEAESFHMGYNRIYYGDQAFGNGQWLDDGHPECGRFFRATIRHLKIPSYRYIRVMDLYTLRVMLRNLDRRDYLMSREQESLEEVSRLLLVGDEALGPHHDRQRRLLLRELNAILSGRTH